MRILLIFAVFCLSSITINKAMSIEFGKFPVIIADIRCNKDMKSDSFKTSVEEVFLTILSSDKEKNLSSTGINGPAQIHPEPNEKVKIYAEGALLKIETADLKIARTIGKLFSPRTRLEVTAEAACKYELALMKKEYLQDLKSIAGDEARKKSRTAELALVTSGKEAILIRLEIQSEDKPFDQRKKLMSEIEFDSVDTDSCNRRFEYKTHVTPNLPKMKCKKFPIFEKAMNIRVGSTHI